MSKKFWSKEEDKQLIEAYKNDDLELLPEKLGRSFSNINHRKMQIAKNMVIVDKKAIDVVCNLLKISNDKLIQHIDKSVENASKKHNKFTKKKLEQSHTNLFISYKELYDQVLEIKTSLEEIKTLIKNIKPQD